MKHTSDRESQGSEHGLPDPPETAEPEPANTSDTPVSETLENKGANSNGQHAPQLEPEQEKRYPSRAIKNLRGTCNCMQNLN